jgi:1,4-dihydroxy-6-naphthoate synthase
VPAPRRLRFGFSPCPNDTFAFGPAVHGAVPGDVELVPELADIEALNARAIAGAAAGAAAALPVSKLSLPALARVADRYAVLPSGSALGFGCGPLLVRRRGRDLALADVVGCRVAIPGEHTTANLLLQSLVGRPRERVPMRFDAILGAVAAGDCDAGVIIHESRFTYAAHGLEVIADLGELWERETGGPLPLGVIAARRDLDRATFDEVARVLRASVEHARAHPAAFRAYVRAHAQEMSDEVNDRHIALYVNDFTVDLGEAGRRAIEELLRRGRALGLLPAGCPVFREDA